MSRENVELHRRLTAAFNSRATDALLAVCDPTVEVHSGFAAVGGATYQGHDGPRRWLRDIIEAWTEFRVDLEADFDLGEQTLAFVSCTGAEA